LLEPSPAGATENSTTLSPLHPPNHSFHLRWQRLRDSSDVMVRGSSRIFALIRRSAMPALALIVVGTFAGHAIAGPNGILAWGSYHRELKQRQAELVQIERQRAELRHQSQLL